MHRHYGVVFMASIEFSLPGDEAPAPQAWSDRSGSVALAGRRFYVAFLICLALISIPIKNLAYVVPPLYLCWELLAGDSSGGRILLLTMLCVAVSSVSLLVDAFSGQAVNVPGLLLAIVTYAPLFLFLGTGWDRQIDAICFHKISTVTAWFVIVQSLIGAIQFALTRNGDAVTGTFGLLDFYLNTISIAQVYFTFTLFGMILFLMLDTKRPLSRIAIFAGLLTCALAQSGHQTIFFVTSLVIISAIQLKRVGTALRGALLAAFLILLMMQLYPQTWTHTVDWYRKVVDNPRSAKRMVLSDSLALMANPKIAFLGVGMGQYSSRAALITSNEYLSRELPSLLAAKSDYFSDSMMPALAEFNEVGEGSAISKPYFSALTVFVELGLPLALACLVGGWVHWRRNFAWLRSDDPSVARIGLVSCVGLLLVVLCCGIENYLEFPQAIFLPFLLYIVAQSRAWQLTDEVDNAVDSRALRT
jgi:hypothetical protein